MSSAAPTTLAEAVAYCIIEAMERFTKHISPLTVKTVSRASNKQIPPVPESVVDRELMHKIKEFDEKKSVHTAEKKQTLAKKRQLKQENAEAREMVRE